MKCDLGGSEKEIEKKKKKRKFISPRLKNHQFNNEVTRGKSFIGLNVLPFQFCLHVSELR